MVFNHSLTKFYCFKVKDGVKQNDNTQIKLGSGHPENQVDQHLNHVKILPYLELTFLQDHNDDKSSLVQVMAWCQPLPESMLI